MSARSEFRPCLPDFRRAPAARLLFALLSACSCLLSSNAAAQSAPAPAESAAALPASPQTVPTQPSSTPSGPAQSAPAPPAPAAPRPIVVLDPAHGGDDPGARLDTLAEKDFTLALSIRLRSLLAARGFQVITTRESDASLNADRRAEIANRVNALACLSLHGSNAGTGLHLFVSSLAPAAPTRVPAWKTAQAAWVTRSIALAGVVNAALLHAGLPVTLGRTALPGIDSMTCPAVAVEVAPEPAVNGSPSSDAAPGAGLEDPAYQAKVAAALAAALLEWKTEGRQP